MEVFGSEKVVGEIGVGKENEKIGGGMGEVRE